jgi:hypothetical protein
MPELKVTADHLKRDAYLYVRQSTLRQVAEHGESTQRQYALRDRAIASGWPIERVHVIDRDLGKSGSSTTARDGFQQLVSEVALGKAGINTAEGWSQDVSEDIVSEVLERAFDGDDTLSEATKRFVDRHASPGEKRPPAPSVRRDTGADDALRVGGRKTGQ